jgi:hypothetical protein
MHRGAYNELGRQRDIFEDAQSSLASNPFDDPDVQQRIGEWIARCAMSAQSEPNAQTRKH